jgi:hypothetical protein
MEASSFGLVGAADCGTPQPFIKDRGIRDKPRLFPWQTPLAGYRLVILALGATGFLSFGLWAHHMFATGILRLSLGFFSPRQI